MKLGLGVPLVNYKHMSLQEKLSGIGGLTFFKDFSSLTLDAEYALGSRTATFTSARDATHPATYVDIDGVIQSTTTADVGRFDYGYYDATGYHAFDKPKLHIEGAGTNNIISTLFSEGDTGGLDDSWSAVTTGLNGTVTWSLVDVSDTCNVGTTVNAQRCQYSGHAGDSNETFYLSSTLSAVGSFVQGDVATITVWVKGSTTTGNFQIGFVEADAGGGWNTAHISGDIKSSISSTEWRKFTFTGTCADADCSRISILGFLFNSDIDANETIDIQIKCPQLEKSPYATSFIPTTTAALSRTAEVLKYVISGNRTAATEGAVFSIIPEYADSVNTGFLKITDTDTKKRFMRFTASANDILVKSNETDSTTSSVTDLINESWTAHTAMKVGYSMQSTGNPNVACYYQGVADGTDSETDFTAPAWGTSFYVGCDNAGNNQMNGWFSSVAFYNKFPTATEQLQIAGIL